MRCFFHFLTNFTALIVGLGAIRYGLCHLQQTAGTVTGRKQAGHSRRAVSVRLDARAVQLRAQLAGKIAAACGAVGDEHTGNVQRFSLGKRHARHQFIAFDRLDLARFCAQTVGQVAGGSLPSVSSVTDCATDSSTSLPRAHTHPDRARQRPCRDRKTRHRWRSS